MRKFAIAGRLVIGGLMTLWLGGFTFYAAFVVPIGARALGSELEQGLVTRDVTLVLNRLAAALALAWGFAIVWTWANAVRRGRKLGVESLAWSLFAVTTGFLFVQHASVDELLDLPHRSVVDHDRFYAAHRIYLIAATLQWLAAVVGAVVRSLDEPSSYAGDASLSVDDRTG